MIIHVSLSCWCLLALQSPLSPLEDALASAVSNETDFDWVAWILMDSLRKGNGQKVRGPRNPKMKDMVETFCVINIVWDDMTCLLEFLLSSGF